MQLEDFNLIHHECATVRPGMQFGRLTVLLTGKPAGSYRYKAVCQCQCGSIPFVLRNDALTSGATTSCGCYHLEAITKHGMYKHPLYFVWRGMNERCFNPEFKFYADYGGRGITVCERWLDPRNFVEDMYPTYMPGLTIERKDNNGNYEPDNCIWATAAEQADNRRSGHRVTFNGKTQSILKWSKETEINYGTLWERLVVHRWTPERALTTPAMSADERMAIARAVRWG